MIKSDEVKFRQALYNASLKNRVIHTSEVFGALGMHRKRAWYLLEKFTRKGFIDYGTSVNFVWLTEKGEQFKPFTAADLVPIIKATIEPAIKQAFRERGSLWDALQNH